MRRTSETTEILSVLPFRWNAQGIIKMPRNSRREDCQGADAIDQFQDSASREIAEAPRPSGMAKYHRGEEVHGFPTDEVNWTWTRSLRNALEYSTRAGSRTIIFDKRAGNSVTSSRMTRTTSAPTSTNTNNCAF
jgi:hypothetical protein